MNSLFGWSPAGPVESPVSWVALAAARRAPVRPSAATEATEGALTAAPPSAKAAGVNPIAALINNASPGLATTQTGQSPAGVVTGALTVNDPDSTAVGIAVTRPPAHGTVTVAGGRYAYTADPALAHAGYTDSFAVTVDDSASGFHIHGFDGLINLMTFGLFGLSGHSTTRQVSVTVAPFNNPPSATVRVGSPDPVTGIVTGAVSGTDPNGDALTYSGSSTTAKGSVTVSATGEFSYTPTSQALAGAAAPTAGTTDRQDSFTVTVDDAHGGIVAVPVTVPIGVVAAPPAPLSTFCGCTLMPADTVFHADVSTLPVLPESGAWTQLLGGTLRAAWGGEVWMNNTAGMPVNTVSASRPTETVIFNRGLVTSGPSIDNRPYAIPDRPLVEGMPNVPAWDRHLLVFQEGTCTSQELYNVANGVEMPANSPLDALGNAAYASQYGSAWIAEAGVQVDMNSPLYPAKGWANASRLPYLPLILRPDDLARGSIDHMLGIAIAKDRGTGYTWPARAGDGTGTNPDGVPMGTVFRLSSDFDVSGYSPATQVVLRALQQHGAVVFDSIGAGQDGATLLAMSNGWAGTDHLTAQRELRTVPLSAFEAVDVLSLATDPSAGWAIRV
ncbi:MAG: Ig-like domain-containing protein [Mycobacterium sp.]